MHEGNGGQAKLDESSVVYEKLDFGPGGVKRTEVTRAPLSNLPGWSGRTFSLSTLPDGRSYVVITNVESDNRIEIQQINGE